MKKKWIIIGVVVIVLVLAGVGLGQDEEEPEEESVIKSCELATEEDGVEWYSVTLNKDYWGGMTPTNKDLALEIIGEIYQKSGADNLSDFVLTAYEENGDQAFMFSDGGYSIQFYKDGNFDAEYLLLDSDREELKK